jgi:hypothetical protein
MNVCDYCMLTKIYDIKDLQGFITCNGAKQKSINTCSCTAY